MIEVTASQAWTALSAFGVMAIYIVKMSISIGRLVEHVEAQDERIKLNEERINQLDQRQYNAATS